MLQDILPVGIVLDLQDSAPYILILEYLNKASTNA